jgi:hypothetical protein
MSLLGTRNAFCSIRLSDRSERVEVGADLRPEVIRTILKRMGSLVA